MNRYEKITIKKIGKDGFDLLAKPDGEHATIKAPDFLFGNRSNYHFLGEAKVVTKMPRKESAITDGDKILGFCLDSSVVVDSVLSDVSQKRLSIIKVHPEYEHLPYIFFLYNSFWLWDRLGFADADLYKKYPYISGTFYYKGTDPNSSEWKGLNVKDLEAYIKKRAHILPYRKKFIWEVFVNKGAYNPIDLSWFSDVTIVN